MIGLNLAVVHSQVPSRHGVLVMWRNMTQQGPANAAKDGYAFVRCGVARAHPILASVTDLPAVGELGLVATVDNEVNVWVCSLHWQDDNAIAWETVNGADQCRTVNRQDSGITTQSDATGDWQADLPGGVTIRATLNDTPMVMPPGPRLNEPGFALPPFLCIDHPSGLTVKISPSGDIAINEAASVSLMAINPIAVTSYGAISLTTLPMTSDPTDFPVETQPNIDITINSGGVMNLNATGAVNLQGGGAQFAMAAIVDWATNHTHSSFGTPATPAPGTSCKSATTVQGLAHS